MKKVFVTIGILLTIIVVGFFILNSYIYNEKQAGAELTQEQAQTLVSIYIKENISTLSPEPEVLGGTFYVTNIEFTGESRGTVEYEDGHIALVADFAYSINEAGGVEVLLTNVGEPQP